MKIIDSHVHVYPEFLKKERDRIAAREPWFELLTSSKVQKWGTVEELVAAMDEAGIESSLVTTFAFRDQGLCREMNDYVLDAARRWPGRILPLAVVSPARMGTLEEAERAFDAGALGLGEFFPDGQGFDLASPAWLRDLCALCEARDKSMLFHTAEQGGLLPQFPDDARNLRALRRRPLGLRGYAGDAAAAAKRALRHRGVAVALRA